MGPREAHVRELASQLGVDVVLRAGGNDVLGFARSDRVLEVRGWGEDRQGAYFTALHELGHFTFKHNESWEHYNRLYRNRSVEAESEAWLYAFESANEEPTPEVFREIGEEWLGSYVKARGLTSAGPTYNRVASMVGLELAA